jgi:hypothetical protein
MDDSTDEQIEYIIFKICVYSKGALSVDYLNSIPLPMVLKYCRYCEKLDKELQDEVAKQRSR